MGLDDFFDLSRQSLSIKSVCASREEKYAGQVKDQSGQKNTFSALLLLFAKYDFSKENKDLANAVSQVAGNGQEPSFDGLCSMFNVNCATLYFAMMNTSTFADYFFWQKNQTPTSHQNTSTVLADSSSFLRAELSAISPVNWQSNRAFC